jgi:patatin-like phospholipase/acyl hydrolase
MAEKNFYILAIDGGGVRGIYPAHILKRIRDEFNVDFPTHFDLIAGTSTGSILAAALAAGIPLEDVVALYENEAAKVFAPRFSAKGLFRSLYRKKHLADVLKIVFGDKTLTAARTRLLIPATDITNGCVHVFKSPFHQDFVRDRDVRIASAILASCSAPIYFDPEVVDAYLIADGGLWANNPSLGALVEATSSRLGVPLERVRLLSLGTGLGHQRYSLRAAKTRPWGMITWGPRRLVDLILSLQSATAANMTRLLLHDHCLRIDFNLAGELRLDAHEAILDLKAQADHDFTHNSAAIKAFLGI